MLLKNNKSLLFTIIFLVIFSIFDTFTNTYILLRENYEKRMVKRAGDCNAQGYGFYKNIKLKFPNIKSNITAINFDDFPSPEGYFFRYDYQISKNYLILINADKKIINKYLSNNFNIIHSDKNCYLLKK